MIPYFIWHNKVSLGLEAIMSNYIVQSSVPIVSWGSRAALLGKLSGRRAGAAPLGVRPPTNQPTFTAVKLHTHCVQTEQ